VAALTPGADVEWWMHFQIPKAEIHRHHQDNCEVKESGLHGGVRATGRRAGEGLFTKVARQDGDFIIGFPGYWMHARVFEESTAEDKELYAFAVPDTDEWRVMEDLVYVIHDKAQSNYINSGTVKDGEVINMRLLCVPHIQKHPYTHTHTQTQTNTHTHTRHQLMPNLTW
jgi:hypothetical protein